MDNLEFGKSATGGEAERKRGGGCIIGVLENEIDLQLQIHKESGLLILVINTSNSPQNRLQGA